MATHETGALISSGAADWQIVQQRADGTATLTLTGRWRAAQDYREAKVLIRLIDECTQEPVTQTLQWRPAVTRPDGTWTAELGPVPAGGIYRIETALRLDGCAVEWSMRGDMVHHLGVGDIWLIAGQSNAAGYGKTPITDGPELGIHMFHARGCWTLATHPLGDSTATRFPANRGRSNASHSPWLAFARRLKHSLGYPIGLIPSSLGGSPMAAWDRAEQGHLFTNMLRYVEAAGGKVKGIVWYQGESDARPQAARLYAERFARFVTDVRSCLGDPQLPILTVQLNRWVGQAAADNHTGWEMIREIQRRLPEQIPGAYVVPAADLGLSDGIHNNSLGNVLLGERMAQVALGAVYGRDINWRFPDCRRAVTLAPDLLELTFANVGIRLNYENTYAVQLPFAVRDAQGDVPVVAWELPGPDRFRLKLGRPLQGDATVTGLPGCNPPPIIPSDIDSYRPMLGFTIPVTGD
ncbi:MAG: sialate O-acetylesterase [Limnochordia bacterium]|jgi:sialate O-acetylesterase